MRACKVDRNQKEIVESLRKAGVTVLVLSAVGQGCPDLLCGHMGYNFLLEVKDGEAKPSARKLNPEQVQWHQWWRGQVVVVETAEQAVRIVTMGTKP
jgi:Holliday junction resolvase